MKLIAALTLMCVAYATADAPAEADDGPWTYKTYVKNHLSAYGIILTKVYELCDECQAETKCDTSLFAKMAVRQFPEDQKLKCFWGCLAEKLNVVMGKRDPAYLNADALANKLNPTQLDMASKCLGYYMKPAFGDQCNQVYMSHKCYMWTMDKVHSCQAEEASPPAEVEDDPTPIMKDDNEMEGSSDPVEVSIDDGEAEDEDDEEPIDIDAPVDEDDDEPKDIDAPDDE